jgi:hypothetical protein
VVNNASTVNRHLPDCERYIRKYLHDQRNCLAALDLQFLLLQQAVTNPSDTTELQTCRKLIACLEELQHRLGLRFRTPNVVPVSLSWVFEECKTRQSLHTADREITWTQDGADCLFLADEQVVSIMIVELVDHCFGSGCGRVCGLSRNGTVSFQMRRAELEEQCMDSESSDELSALVSRYGGLLKLEESGHGLELSFPRVTAIGDGVSQ